MAANIKNFFTKEEVETVKKSVVSSIDLYHSGRSTIEQGGKRDVIVGSKEGLEVVINFRKRTSLYQHYEVRYENKVVWHTFNILELFAGLDNRRNHAYEAGTGMYYAEMAMLSEAN